MKKVIKDEDAIIQNISGNLYFSGYRSAAEFFRHQFPYTTTQCLVMYKSTVYLDWTSAISRT